MKKDIILFESFGSNQNPTHSEIAVKTLHIIIQFQMFHWQTEKYSQHNIFDKFINDFKELGDQLVEVISGIYGRVVIQQETAIPIRNISELDSLGFIEQAIDIYNVYKENIVKEAEIITIIDEILALFQQLKYLLSFN